MGRWGEQWNRSRSAKDRRDSLTTGGRFPRFGFFHAKPMRPVNPRSWLLAAPQRQTM